jgi:plastocyanin
MSGWLLWGLLLAAGSVQAGSIEGRVLYEADATRPWRFVRYYVAAASGTGPLAETVVSLRGTALKNWPAPSAPRTHTVDQELFQFTPETIAIRAGDAVLFTNSDTTTHNVRASESIATFNINMDAGGEYTHVFDRAGGLRVPVRLGCVYHGGMRAWVYVFDHPFYAITAKDGRFRFEGVPPGEYTLELVHPAGSLRSKQTVSIPAEGDVQRDIRVTPDDKFIP